MHAWRIYANIYYPITITLSDNMATPGPGDNLESVLKYKGLDTQVWLPVFKNKRITSQEALQHVMGDEKFCSELEKDAKYDWEKKVLHNLLNVEKKKKLKHKLAGKLKLNKKGVQSAQKPAYDEAMLTSQDSEDITMTTINDQDSLSKAEEEQHTESDSSFVSLEEITTPLVSSSGLQRKNISMLIETVSGGQALRGVLYTKHIADHMLERSCLLQAPKHASLRPTYQNVDFVKYFSLKYEEDEYNQAISILGHQAAVSDRCSVFGKQITDNATMCKPSQPQKSDKGFSFDMYSSVVKHSTVQLATYYLSNTDLLLSDEALIELRKLKGVIASKGGKIQAECEMFLKKFGSHVRRGPIHFGGVCRWTCSSSGFRCSEREAVKKLQNQVVSTVSSPGVGFTTESNTQLNNIKEDFNHKCSNNTLANTQIKVKVNGGPSGANNFDSWKEELSNNDSMWIITDPGKRYIAVWDIIAMNYSQELSEIIDFLGEAWEKMTGLSRERVQLPSFTSDTVFEYIREWNKSINKASQAIVKNLKYLIEVKTDVILITGNPNAWMDNYLSQPPLQEFLRSVLTSEEEKEIPSGDIRFLMQQLIDPLQLQQMSLTAFSEMLHGRDCTFISSKSKGFRFLDEYLQCIIEEMEFNKTGKELLLHDKSAEHGEIIIMESDAEVARAILAFRSQCKDSFEGVLITILIHPFMSDNYNLKDPIQLHPIVFDDLKLLHEQFKEQWKKFRFYKDKGNSLKLQAYLFHLAVSIYNADKKVKYEENQLKHCLMYIKDNLCLLSQMDPPIAQLLGEYMTNTCNLVQFHEGMETMMRTGLPPAESYESHSLQRALLTEVHHELLIQGDQKSVLLKNPKVHCLFQELDLCDYYPKKLSVEDALRIRPDILRMSLNKIPISHSSQLAKLILHKIMAYDHLCRSDLMHSHKDRSMKIHPVDSLLAVLMCSDDFLNQDLMSRLAKCQLAIPFILPDPFTGQLILPLWSMRSIVKEWKYIQDGGSIVERACPILSYNTPIVSFIRIGKRQKRGASKSKIMNEVISEYHYDHFFNRDCAGGHFELLMGEGLIDMCWYLPAAKPDDALPVAVTFLNLHGDARQYPQQCKILCEMSSICFVLLTEEESMFDQHCIASLKPFASTLGGVILLNDADQPPEKLHKALAHSEIIDIQSMNAHDTKVLIRKTITDRLPLNSLDNFKSIEQCTEIALSLHLDKLYVDEDNESFRKGKEQADKLIKLACIEESGYLGAKQAILPLQGQGMWQAWAKKDKEFSRHVQRGKCTVHEYNEKITTEMEAIRKKQLQYVTKLTPVMESFVVSLLSLGGISNSMTRNFFLQCLKIGLNDLSRTGIAELQVMYVATRQALHKVQTSINSNGSDSEVNISHLKKELSKLHTELINASFGLEHLLRELGQLYETAAAQQKSNPSIMQQVSRLPEAAAELLIDGYPIEVMDGDAAHVQIRWIKAVLKKVVQILNDPKVYIMTILGLQSTGKSTMLNTMFGLDFNVSAGHGRCARGAFMQLLPVSEEMKCTTGCAYILVVDTEGLRATEFDSQQTKKHDNELATFVIGLANVTLINVYGEVPGDIDDILQTSVHAFLRMNKVKYNNPSCQFVHQNAGASVNSEVGRANFIKKLNDMTLDAAKAELLYCTEQYKTFNDVIQFDDLRDVHHFPGLWKGDPPMGPVNQGYSECAQNLKYHIIDLLERGARIEILSQFETKIGDLWDALLMEKFVFSFKNTLEITAYNSLEAHYNNSDWKFQKCMLEWEKRAENGINAAKPEDIEVEMSNKKKEAEEYVQNKYEELKQEMDNFFEVSKQSDTLIQWKAKFELKLESLSEELKIHAKRHCERVGTGRQANSKFEEEKKEYEAQMTEMVEEIIQRTKREQEYLNSNLEKGELDDEQVEKVMKDGLFEFAKIEQYRKLKIISKSQLDSLKQLYRRSQHASSKTLMLTKSGLRKILEGKPSRILSLYEIRAIFKLGKLKPEELRQNFDKNWSELVRRLPPVHDSSVKVEEAVEEMLIKFVGKEGKLIKQFQEKRNSSLRDFGSCEPFEVMEDLHYYKIKKHYFVEGVIKIAQNNDPHKREAQSVTNEVFELAIKYLDDKVSEGTDFSKVYIPELLRKLEEKIYKRSGEFSSHFYFTTTYRIHVFTKVCGHAIRRFEEMAEAFRERNNPRVYLERKLKNPLFAKFKIQYYRTTKEEAIACILCAHLAEPVKIQIQDSLCTEVVLQMKISDFCFNTKTALKTRILIDLGDDIIEKGGRHWDERSVLKKCKIPQEHFQDYFLYIANQRESIKEWLCKYIIKYCDKAIEKNGPTQLQAIAKEKVNQLILFLKDKVSRIKVTDASEWLKQFCEDEHLISELGLKLDTSAIEVEEMQELNLDTFTEKVLHGLSDLESNMQSEFSDITCKSGMHTWRYKPVDLLMHLCGCTEQCPFCNEQCDLGAHDESIKHTVHQHMPQCLSGHRFTSNNVMSLDLCPTKVAGTGTFLNPQTKKERIPYREYTRIYPTWFIPLDVNAKSSLYWKWFIGNFHEEVAAHFEVVDAEIPDGWKQLKWQKVKEVMQKYHC